MQPDHSDNLVGVLLGGRYLIQQLIAFGGFGAVYRARQSEMEKEVAIKLLHRRYSIDIDAVKRFQQEARIISTLRHQNILAVYSMGTHDDRIYMVMEFVHGKSMLDIVLDRGAMPWQAALPMLLQICRAMSYAHENDILHRDLKPANVLISDEEKQEDGSPRVRVVDFGLAKLLGDGQRLTRTGEVVGDPHYMSPEQAQGKKLDRRSDIYSFGCLAYQLLTGVPPFEAESAVALLFKQVSEDPPPIPEAISLPLALREIVVSAMEKDPSNRFQSFDDLADALNKVTVNPDFAPSPKHARVKSRLTTSGKQKKLLLLTSLLGGFAVLLGAVLIFQHYESERKDLSERKAVLRAQIDSEWEKSGVIGLDLRRGQVDLLRQAKATGDPDLIARATLLAGCFGAISPEQAIKDFPDDSQISPELIEQKRFVQARFSYAAEDWAATEPIFQHLHDKYLNSRIKHQPGQSKFASFIRIRDRYFIVQTLARIKFHLKKYDEAERLIEESFAQEGYYNDEVRQRRLFVAIARDGFAAVERRLKQEIASSQKAGTTALARNHMESLIRLYGIWGDARVPALGLQFLFDENRIPGERYDVMNETISVAIARHDLAVLERCYHSKTEDALRSEPDDLMSLARVQFELGKVAEAEASLDDVKELSRRRRPREDTRTLDWLIARTRFIWRLREKKFDEAEKLLMDLVALPAPTAWDVESDWSSIYRLLLSHAELKGADARDMENRLLERLPGEEHRTQKLAFLWQVLRAYAINGITDSSRFVEKLRTFYYKDSNEQLQERNERQLEVFEIYALYRQGKYADVVKLARPLIAKLRSKSGTGFFVSQILEPYCISLDKLGQHAEAQSARKSIAEFVFFDRFEPPPAVIDGEPTIPWKNTVCVDQFSVNEIARF